MEKKQTREKAIITKQKQSIKLKFAKTRNAISESIITTIREVRNLRDLFDDKNKPMNDQKIFPSQYLQHHHL